MIKFSASLPDGLGLSDANLARLQEGQPIAVDLGAELVPGSKVVVTILWGHTEADIRGEVTQLFDTPGRLYLHTKDEPNPSNPWAEPKP